MTTMNPMYASMGLTVAQGVAGFANASIASKLASSMQKYHNKMREISAAMSRDVIQQNRIRTMDASRALEWDIAKSAARDQGAAVVSAAAAGVSGRNVDKQLRGLRRSALGAQMSRKKKVQQEIQQHNTDLRSSEVSLIMGRDITVHARPSILASMAGIGTALFDDHQAARPAGDRFGGGSNDPTANTGFVDWWQ